MFKVNFFFTVFDIAIPLLKERFEFIETTARVSIGNPQIWDRKELKNIYTHLHNVK